MNPDGRNARAAGQVVWPVALTDTCEGGMFVLAVWWQTTGDDDPLLCSVEPRKLRFLGPEWVAASDRRDRARADYVKLARDVIEEMSPHVLGCLVLGSTNASYSLTGEWPADWRCQRWDLTPAGRAAVEALDAIYGRPAELLTFTDT